MSVSGGSSCGDPTANDGGEVDDIYGVPSRAKRGVKTNWKTGPANLRGWDKASTEEEKAAVMGRRVLHGIVQNRHPTESPQNSSKSSSGSNVGIRLASISGQNSYTKGPDTMSLASSSLEVGNYIGRAVVKEFPNQGFFNGKVTAYDDLEDLWQVTYTDGDQEEYAAQELESYLVPESNHSRPLNHQLFKFSPALPSSGNAFAEEERFPEDDTQTFPCFKCSGLEVASKLLLCDGKTFFPATIAKNLSNSPSSDWTSP